MVQECVSPAPVNGAASGFTSRHLPKCALNARLSFGGGSRPSFQSIKTLLILVLAFLSLHDLLSFTLLSRRQVPVPGRSQALLGYLKLLLVLVPYHEYISEKFMTSMEVPGGWNGQNYVYSDLQHFLVACMV